MLATFMLTIVSNMLYNIGLVRDIAQGQYQPLSMQNKHNSEETFCYDAIYFREQDTLGICFSISAKGKNFYHYENTPFQKIMEISPPKTENFQIKKNLMVFIFLLKT